MLPGIRFLFAAIILSTSILIFGLGAAALLRAAHKEVANIPTRRVMAEPIFTPQSDAQAPTLAMLRIEPVASTRAPETQADAIPLPELVVESAPVPSVPTEPLAALKPDDVAPAETTKSEVAAKPQEKPEIASAEASPALAAAAAPPSAETRLAALDATPPRPAEASPVGSEQKDLPANPDTGVRPTRTVSLGEPAAKTETTTEVKKTSEKPDRAEVRRKQRAERARERRRQAARRARLAAQQAAAQQIADPFAEAIQSTQPATTTARRRQ